MEIPATEVIQTIRVTDYQIPSVRPPTEYTKNLGFRSWTFVKASFTGYWLLLY